MQQSRSRYLYSRQRQQQNYWRRNISRQPFYCWNSRGKSETRRRVRERWT